MKNTSFLKRMAAFALTLVLVIGLLPQTTLLPVGAAGETDLVTINKIVDPESFESWRDYYGTNSILPDGTRGMSTWKAGGVWTNKSVYADELKLPSGIVMNDRTNNFLVALSALASTKEIVGQSSTPSDTFMVLDVSGSMDDNSKAEGMVEAANRAIHALLSQNKSNRIGIVLYSGTRTNNGSTATTLLLPLDHYTTTSTVNAGTSYAPEYIPQYLTISNSITSPDVGIARGVRNGNNVAPASVEREVKDATYIQRGLYDAWTEFKDVTDVRVPAGNAQAGAQRKPIVILMSDGRPTLATEDYNSVGLRDSEHGDGTESTTTWKTVFLTQLTAAYIKGAISDHYNTEALFYSLGLGTSNDTYATGVLNPSSTNNRDVLTWWSNFKNGDRETNGTVEVAEEIEGSGRPGWPGYVAGQDAWYLDYDDEGFAKNTGRNYVDKYWAASNVDSMIQAFDEIVAQIGLQSKYSATLVESGDADLDGYITVEDELGSMMQVKDVKGIVIGNKIFSGEELAKSMNEGELGGIDTPTEYGNEFVRTVKERLGITQTSKAQQLIQAAYADGQLDYDYSTGEYSNYIGWYGDGNNAYLGFWDKDTGITAEGAPEGAKYINLSYGYLGGASNEENAADMMHIVVIVRTEIATGHQTVLFKIPSSLIPMVEYKVEIEGESLETATDVKLTVVENDPIRLVYEVGVYDGVNNINIDKKVEEYLAQNGANHIHKNEDGNYVFYANGWDNDHDEKAPDISKLSDAQKAELVKYVAESHFVPNTLNERFYIQENSVVYTENGNRYVPVTSGISEGGTYYFARTIVTVVGTTPTVQTQYELLQPATIADDSVFEKNAETGYWEIKAGTIRQHLTDLVVSKGERNYTDTLANSDHLWVNVTGDDSSDYNVYSFLGNNGKITVVPATGIKVTKDLEEVANGAAADEKFAITVTVDAVVADAVCTDVDGNVLDDYVLSTDASKTYVTVNLADGESFVVSGLPAGVDYSVSEAPHTKYTYSYTGANKTVAATIVEGTVTNTPVVSGGLTITKEVSNVHGGMNFPTDEEFEIEVTFTDENGAPIAITKFDIENDWQPELIEENGVIKGSLRHGETAFIKNIPAGTHVVVKEVNVPSAYASPTYSSINKSGDTPVTSLTMGEVTIESGKNATVEVFNTYIPEPAEVDVNVNGIKNFDATNMTVSADFMFVLEKYEDGEWKPVGSEQTSFAPGENESKPFDLGNHNIQFTEPGAKSFRIRESAVTPNPDITYDRSVYTFSAVATLDENGDLKAEIVGHNTDVSGDAASGYEVNAEFTNYYHSTATNIEVEKTVDDKAGSGKTPAGFTIEVYTADENWNIGAKVAATVTDSQGKAVLVRNYDNSDFANDTDGDGVVKYYYIIKEAAEKTGWKNDPAEYRVTVTLTKDAQTSEISAEFDIIKAVGTTETNIGASGDSATISFKNTYDPQNAEVDLDILPTVNKSLIGRDLDADEFTFAIFENGNSSFTNTSEAIMIGKNVAAKDGEKAHIYFEATDYGVEKGLADGENNTLIFSKIGKYEYDIVEIEGALGGVKYSKTIYDLTVEVTDQNGTLSARHYFVDGVGESVTFTNTYSAESTGAVIEGIKKIEVNSGVKELIAGMFKFGLYDEAGEKIDEAYNLANGRFAFDKIEYSFADVGKTFKYTVKEIAPDGTTDGSYKEGGISYSAQSFEVSVIIKDNGDGTLSADVTGNGIDNIEFVNVYESKTASVTLRGDKDLEGRDLTAGEYDFVLYSSNSSFTEEIAIVKQNGEDFVTHDAKGEFVFVISGLGMGEYHYILREVIPEERAEGIKYDASEYYVTVSVFDEGNGQMRANKTVYHTGQPNVSNPDISFKNIYTPKPDDITVVFNIVKNVDNKGTAEIGPDGFEFVLKTLQDGVADVTDVSDEDGKASFTLTFGEEDIGNTYTYEITETKGDEEHLTYDETKHTVTVAIELGADNKLVAKFTVNGDEADEVNVEFNNTYDFTPKADDPMGDESSFLLWPALLIVFAGAIITLALIDKKKRINSEE